MAEVRTQRILRGVVIDVHTGLPFTNSHNARSAKLRFYIPHAGILQ